MNRAELSFVRLRKQGVIVALLGATLFFATELHRHYAINTWLFWRYCSYWLLALGWLGSCQLAGYGLLSLSVGRYIRRAERQFFGLALGVLAFAMAIFVLGLMHALNVVTFVALPVLFGVFGWRHTRVERRQFVDGLKQVRTFGPGPLLGIGLAMVALVVVYFQLLSPDTYSFDARWYHMPMAQRYALSGSIGRFAEGFWPAAFPHLFSYVYAWAFLTPGMLIFDQVVLCGHLEFVLCLATMAQIPVMVRALLPGTRAPLLWATFLLFPGIYIYDLNLHGGADHATAFWALPVALASYRAWYKFDAPRVALAALMIAAAVLTKYTSLPLIAPAGFALLFRGLWLLARRGGKRAVTLQALGWLVFGSLLFTAPQWLKNFLWYGDPIYPMLRHHLDITPTLPELDSRLAILETTGRPGEFTPQGILRGLRAMFDFSFVPNNWEFLYGRWPVFGSLFTLTLPVLLFLRRSSRVVWLYVATMGGVFVWYMLTHYDRYLQALVPAMAAATAATFVLVARRGRAERWALAALVSLQVIWALDLPFVRTHNQIHDSSIRHVAAFIPSGFEKRQGSRLKLYEPLNTIGSLTPEGATVLARNHIMILGLNRNWVTDHHQSLINYATLGSPGAIDAQLKELGVTHLVWAQAVLGRDSLAEELSFLAYAMRHTRGRKALYGNFVAALPEESPAASQKYLVAHMGCRAPYTRGWYNVSQLTLPTIRPGKSPRPIRVLPRTADLKAADLLVTDAACPYQIKVPPAFELAGTRHRQNLYVKK